MINEDIVITKADKGNTVVILDTSEYKSRMHNLLERENFTKIDKKPIRNKYNIIQGNNTKDKTCNEER